MTFIKNIGLIRNKLSGKLTLIKKIYLRYGILLWIAVILAAGFYAYRVYSEKQFVEEDVIDTFDEGIPAKCESGEWIIFPDFPKSSGLERFSENAKMKYVEGKNAFTDENGTKTYTTDKDYSLFFFMDREVRAEGYKTGGKENYVQKIKCVGEEADKEIQGQRQKLMNYVSKNIDSIALEKSPRSTWQVETFYFVNNNDLYIEYESPGSLGGEAPYDGRLWLIRATKLERSTPVLETLAYIQQDESDPDKNVLKVGEDLYGDQKNMTIYEYDEEVGRWVLQ